MRTPPPDEPGSSGAGEAGHAENADPRLASQVAELSMRLRAVCADWREAEFDALVQRIARTKLRWADEANGSAPH